MCVFRQLFLAVLVFGNLHATGQNVFFEKYPDAIETAEKTYEKLELLQSLPNEKGRILFSIVAPEVAMYKKFMDVFETKTAELFYTNWGSDYANFSLGIFQMKPAFAEKIESEYINKFPKGRFKDSLKYIDTGLVEIRSKRIERLKSSVFQQIYLICFYDLLEIKYKNQITSLEDKISFYAAAYNYGIDAPENEIKKWQSKISFPGRGEPALISYSDLSLAFLKLWVEIPAQIPIVAETKDGRVEIDSIQTSQQTQKTKPKVIQTKKENSEAHDNSTLYYLLILIGGAVAGLIIFMKQKKML